MNEMSEEERRSFLTGQSRTGKLATVGAGGRPHVARIWYDLDDERPPFAFVLVEGVAQIGQEPEPLRRWATRIGGRYMGGDRAGACGRRNDVPGELLVRIAPTHIVARAGIAD